jgi:hypothetical protein
VQAGKALAALDISSTIEIYLLNMEQYSLNIKSLITDAWGLELKTPLISK